MPISLIFIAFTHLQKDIRNAIKITPLQAWKGKGVRLMTPDEKKQIAEMRREGYSYSRVSRELGINENTVKTFCRRNGLTGNKAEMPEMSGFTVTQKPCHQCGSAIIQLPGHKEKKFCSDACRNRWWNNHLEQAKRKSMHEYRCPVCGQIFWAYGTRNRKYCSHACYIRARFGGAPCA